MLNLTEAALEKLREFIEAVEDEGLAVRVGIMGRGPRGFLYSITLEPAEGRRSDDTLVETAGLLLLVDARSAPLLEGTTLDWVEREGESGFQFDNPNPLWSDPVASAVQRVIDDRINPGVASHGGSVMLLDVRDGVAYIEFGGGCQGCGMANVTLKEGVEKAIREAVPEIVQVLDTTDHASGRNPYYRERGPSPLS